MATSPSKKKRISRKSPRKSKTRVFYWSHVHLSIYLLSISALLTFVVACLLYLFVALDIPDIGSLESYQPPQTTLILDDQERVIDRIFTQNRRVISLDEMSDLIPKAFMAAEDARFYEHPGVDGWSILRAVIHNLKKGGRGQGGSTITQQVARSLLLTPEKTYTRKVREAILAYRIDKLLAKEEIISIYLNQIYLGEGAYGVEAAAQVYFDKRARDLNLAEITILAGLPQAPSRYSPFKAFKLAKKRQAYVLNRMVVEGFITPTAARKAFEQTLVWGGAETNLLAAKYFIQQVRNEVSRKYGRDTLYNGGLTIHTCLDQNLQRQADMAIQKGIAHWAVRQKTRSKELPQAALVAIEVKTGLVRALTGGTNFSRSQYNRATQAKRQPGSAFKPLVYAAAFERGFHGASIVEDKPLVLPGTGSGKWRPKNFTGRFEGPTTLWTGLVQSRNIVAIKLMQKTGVGSVIELAAQMGIHSKLRPDLSLALGASEMSLLEVTSAYTVFANDGKWIEPVFITRIEDAEGMVLEEKDLKFEKVLNRGTAYQITSLLEGVIDEGTGKKAWGLRSSSAGKTGTTDQNRDAWFVGYTPTLATGVWMGFDRKTTLGRGETGGRSCAPIWLDFMRRAEKKYPIRKFAVPPEIVFLPIVRKTGEYAPGNRDKSRWQPFRKDQLPLEAQIQK